MNTPSKTFGFLRYVGGKFGLAKEISARLHGTGRTCLVDVFGGSGAVIMNAGFQKRVYNDTSQDLVNMFRVLADDTLRTRLFRKLRWLPPCRDLFEEYRIQFVKSGMCFRGITCQVDRAAATFYRLAYSYGGKYRSGGFQISVSRRNHIKEPYRYRNILKTLSRVGRIFRDTVIENADCIDVVTRYGRSPEVVLFIDPPYPGFNYYVHEMSREKHVFLAHALEEVGAPVICTFYDHEWVRELYPENAWLYEEVDARKNTNIRNFKPGSRSTKTKELILTKRLS